MTPRGCKRKGRDYQNVCRDDFLEVLQCHPDDLKCTLMSGAGMDLQVSPALRERFPFHLCALCTAYAHSVTKCTV